MKKPRTQTSFLIFAVALLLLAGVLIALSLPRITQYRYSVATRLISQASQTQDIDQQKSLFEQAHLIASDSNEATGALARFWLDRGETSKAIAVYESGPSPDYNRIGSIALSAQDYSEASRLYQKSSKTQPSTDSLTGEAIALYNQDRIADGCAKAVQASKQSLESQTAKNAVLACIILGGTQAEAISLVGQKPAMSDREIANFLINAQIYKVGESKLMSIESKTVTDWLVLSRLAIARGDTNLAISSAEKGIELDRSNVEINRQLVAIYTLSGNTNKAAEYSQRLQQLEFNKYQ